MRKIIKISVIILLVAAIFWRYFFYYDPGSGCSITIISSLEFSNLTIKKAIGVLKYGSPEDYKKLCANVSTIDSGTSCGGFGGGCYEGKARRITVSTSQRSLLWTAAVIAHETCHVIQHKENRTPSEEECYKADDNTLKTLVQI